MKDLTFDELVKLTTNRLCRDSGIQVVHGVDFRMTQKPDGDIHYQALTQAGNLALSVMKSVLGSEARP